MKTNTAKQSGARPMTGLFQPFVGLLACCLLASLNNVAEATQSGSFSPSPDVRRLPTPARTSAHDYAVVSRNAGVPLADPYKQVIFGLTAPSIAELFGNCALMFQFAVDDLSIEEREASLTSFCSRILFGDLYEDDDRVLVEDGRAASIDKRASPSENSMQLKRKKRDLNIIGESSEKPAGQHKAPHLSKRSTESQDNAVLDAALQAYDELVKRAGQNRMLHFGKRTQNRYTPFGKGSPSNRFMHFGKRTSGEDSDDSIVDKRANRFMHFGKRENEETDATLNELLEDELIKRSANRFMHFGKRAGTQRYMHFGKRSPSDQEDPSAPADFVENVHKRSSHPSRYMLFGKKAANRFMHFGKRSEGGSDETESRGSDASSGQVKERKRRSVLDDANVTEVRPALPKRFTMYPSPIFQQALLRHRLDLLDKEDVGDDRALDRHSTAPFLGSEDFLDRMGRSQQFQIPQPKARSRWTRPDKNVFLHFG